MHHLGGMASFSTTVSGTIVHTPASGYAPKGTLSIPLTAISVTTLKHSHQVINAQADVDTVLSLGDLTSVKLCLIQKQSGSIIFKITTADGTDQVVPVGKLFLWENESKPITAVKYTGTGEFEVFLAEW